MGRFTEVISRVVHRLVRLDIYDSIYIYTFEMLATMGEPYSVFASSPFLPQPCLTRVSFLWVLSDTSQLNSEKFPSR